MHYNNIFKTVRNKIGSSCLIIQVKRISPSTPNELLFVEVLLIVLALDFH